MLPIQVSVPVLVAGSLGASAAIFANFIYFYMIGKVNERSPPNERVSYLWWGVGLQAKFKRLYPQSRVPRLLLYCYLVAILCFFVELRFWVFG